MASIISAGTTDATSLNVSSDKTGILQLASNNAVTAVTIDASQRVGIGTTSPSTKLHINNASTSATYLRAENNNGYALFGVDASGYAYAGAESNSPFGLVTNGTYRLYIDTSGNVGIGTSSPAYKLNVKNGDIACTSADGTVITRLAYDGLYVSGSTPSAMYLQSATGKEIKFYPNGTYAGQFDSNGQFMVGTSTTGGIITASGAQGGSAVIRSINTTSSGGVAGVVSVLGSNGNNTSSSHFLGSTTGINGWYLYGNGTTSYSSDIRLKKNVQTARGYLNDIARLRVVKYQWIGDNPDCQQVELGLIAQEVEEVFPNLIQEHEIEGVGMRKNIKQSVLPFMLLKSIQELKAINDTQAETINALTARIEALENK